MLPGQTSLLNSRLVETTSYLKPPLGYLIGILNQSHKQLLMSPSQLSSLGLPFLSKWQFFPSTYKHPGVIVILNLPPPFTLYVSSSGNPFDILIVPSVYIYIYIYIYIYVFTL